MLVNQFSCYHLISFVDQIISFKVAEEVLRNLSAWGGGGGWGVGGGGVISRWKDILHKPNSGSHTHIYVIYCE